MNPDNSPDGAAPTPPPAANPSPVPDADADASDGAALSPTLRNGLGQALLMVAMATVTLVWLFHNADSISASSHLAYTRELNNLRQANAYIYSDVLAIRFELTRNYDSISRGTEGINNLIEKLRHTPDFLSRDDARRVLGQIEKFNALAQRKNQLIESFVRESAVLRNSTRYFPTSVRKTIQTLASPRLRAEITALSDEVMTYMVLDNKDLIVPIQKHLEALARESGKQPPRAAAAVRNTIEHAKIMIDRNQAVSGKLHELTAILTDQASMQIIQAYNSGYTRSANRTQIYRVLLFVAALVLALYLVLIFVRLGRASQALRNSNRSLEQRIDELHRTQAHLKLYATVFTSAAEGMVITDARARILVANPAFTVITGYTLEEIRTQPTSLLSSGQHAPAFYQDMWKSLERRGKWQGEIWNRRRNGEVFPEWLSITSLRDNDNRITNYIGIFSDTSERKRNEAHIQHLSQHDSLTNLPNRLMMQERLNEAITQARRINNHAAVLFLNLDRFRNINDTLGSELGDALLQQVAHRSQILLRDTDTVSRLGGDEFVFILPDVNQPQDAAAIARKLLNSASRPYLLGEHNISITASIGIAIFDTDGATAAELLRNADAAMSRAKEDGRNNFRFYSTDMNTSTLGDLLLENQLRGAVDKNELELFYQPKVDARTGCLQSAEALLRWRHPEQGMIPPDRFIRLAEESGLIVPIGEWVLNTACRQLHDWRKTGLPIVPLAINLSAQQFLQNDLPVLIADSLASARLDPALLELELTESMLIRNVERTVGMLARLREMGVGLSIDDFGTGYSSLAYLKQFDVNVLKIDKSFVSDIHNVDADADGKIAIAIIGLAHALGLKVVAEGVETDEQRLFLLDHGCDTFQGYFFSRPIPAADFAKKLAELNPAVLES
ncbi:MAG: EAL domain-containing protein [Azoarcus sp.]|jgi:diguanylate cyclase (GGDEF)-like protein/PAS domain S-box-containing protein|nr:EAL domain-containing protein [Azoarcus sp.]